jgi:hypothetical protein
MVVVVIGGRLGGRGDAEQQRQGDGPESELLHEMIQFKFDRGHN